MDYRITIVMAKRVKYIYIYIMVGIGTYIHRVIVNK